MKRAPTPALTYDLSALLLPPFNLDTISTQGVGHDVPVLTVSQTSGLRNSPAISPVLVKEGSRLFFPSLYLVGETRPAFTGFGAKPGIGSASMLD